MRASSALEARQTQTARRSSDPGTPSPRTAAATQPRPREAARATRGGASTQRERGAVRPAPRSSASAQDSARGPRRTAGAAVPRGDATAPGSPVPSLSFSPTPVGRGGVARSSKPSRWPETGSPLRRRPGSSSERASLSAGARSQRSQTAAAQAQTVARLAVARPAQGCNGRRSPVPSRPFEAPQHGHRTPTSASPRQAWADPLQRSDQGLGQGLGDGLGQAQAAHATAQPSPVAPPGATPPGDSWEVCSPVRREPEPEAEAHLLERLLASSPRPPRWAAVPESPTNSEAGKSGPELRSEVPGSLGQWARGSVVGIQVWSASDLHFGPDQSSAPSEGRASGGCATRPSLAGGSDSEASVARPPTPAGLAAGAPRQPTPQLVTPRRRTPCDGAPIHWRQSPPSSPVWPLPPKPHFPPPGEQAEAQRCSTPSQLFPPYRGEIRSPGRAAPRSVLEATAPRPSAVLSVPTPCRWGRLLAPDPQAFASKLEAIGHGEPVAPLPPSTSTCSKVLEEQAFDLMATMKTSLAGEDAKQSYTALLAQAMSAAAAARLRSDVQRLRVDADTVLAKGLAREVGGLLLRVECLLRPDPLTAECLAPHGSLQAASPSALASALASAPARAESPGCRGMPQAQAQAQAQAQTS